MLQVILLAAAGMSVFDSINHALATMATGGFSTRTASIAAYDSLAIELIIVLFMVLAGVNFSLYIYAWRRGILSIFKDAEFRLYLLILLLSSAVISLALIIQSGLPIGTAVRHAVFQAASIMTTTGFASVNFDEWPGLAKLILFILMFIGGSAGSTAGGIKVARFLILFKISWVHLRQMLNPRLVTTINLQGKPVEPQVLISVTRFFFLFIMIFALAAVLLAGAGLEPFDAMSAVAATLGNVGPGFGLVGPMVNYAPISQFGKTVLIICMLLGRLELFAILVFTQPGFWKYTKAW